MGRSPSQLQKKPKLSWPIHQLLLSKPPQLLPPPKLKLKKRKKNPKKSPTLIWYLTCLVKNLIKKPKCNIIQQINAIIFLYLFEFIKKKHHLKFILYSLLK